MVKVAEVVKSFCSLSDTGTFSLNNCYLKTIFQCQKGQQKLIITSATINC